MTRMRKRASAKSAVSQQRKSKVQAKGTNRKRNPAKGSNRQRNPPNTLPGVRNPLNGYVKPRFSPQGAMEARVAISESDQRLMYAAGNEGYGDVGSSTENVQCYFNPYLALQYFQAYYQGVLGDSNDASLRDAATAAAIQSVLALQNPDSQTVTAWPKRWCQLATACKPQRQGRFSYSFDFSENAVFSAAFAASGVTNTAVGFDYFTPSIPDANGYQAFTFLKTNTSNAVTQFFTQYARQLDLIQYERYKGKHDCSAYAFLNGAYTNPFSAEYTGNAQIVAVCAPFTTLNNVYCIPQSAIMGLEVPITTPWIASLNLTMDKGPTFATNGQNLGRVARNSCATVGLPSSIGFSHSRGYPAVKTLLKPVSTTLSQLTTQQWFENTTSASDKSLVGGRDVAIVFYALQRALLRQYGAASVGTVLTDGVTPATADPMSNQVACQMLKNLRIPEPIADGFESQQASLTRQTNYVPWKAYPASQVNWAGYGSNIVAGDATDPVRISNNVNLPLILNAFEKFMKAAAQYSIVRMLDLERATTCLHSTVVVNYNTDSGVNLVSGIMSTAQLTTAAQHEVLRLVGYQGTVRRANQVPLAASVGRISRRYDQRWFKSDDESATVTNYINVFGSESVPVGAAASNNDEAGQPVSNAPLQGGVAFAPQPPVPLPTPGVVARLSSKLSRILPTYGNYCGKDYTAGKFLAPGENPEMRSGKYLVPPVDPLDAACKQHDERYAKASTDIQRKEADDEFVKLLSALPNLNLHADVYGTAAKEFFSGPRGKEDREL